MIGPSIVSNRDTGDRSLLILRLTNCTVVYLSRTLSLSYPGKLYI